MAKYIFSVFLTFFIFSSLTPSSFILCKRLHRHNHHNPNHYHAHKYEKINNEGSNEIDSSFEAQLDKIWNEISNSSTMDKHGRFIPNFKIPSQLTDLIRLPKINKNWIVDQVLEAFRNLVRGLGLQQVKFENIQIPIPENSIFISGYFNGLDSLKRSGDSYAQIGLKTKFRSGFAMGILNLHVILNENGRQRSFEITYENVAIATTIAVDLLKLPPVLSFSEFEISIGAIKGDFRTGITLLDAHLNLKYKIMDLIQKPTLKVLSFTLKHLFNFASTKIMPLLVRALVSAGIGAVGSAFG